MFRNLLFTLFTIPLVIVLFVSGINGLYPVIEPVHNMINGGSGRYAEVFPWMGMDSVGLLLFISLAKTMASFVFFTDIFGVMSNCMNGFVTLYLFAIFGGAAYFNHVIKAQDRFYLSLGLVGLLLIRHLLRKPKSCNKC